MTLRRNPSKPLRSKSGLKPKPHPDNPFSSFAPRKKGIKRVGKAKAKEKRDTDKLRKAGRTDKDGNAKPCVLCLLLWPEIPPNDSEHTHEITRGTGCRPLAVYEPLVQMGVCPSCHGLLEDAKSWPPERQIAAQWLCVLAAVIRIRGRAATSIQIGDVLPYLRSLASN